LSSALILDAKVSNTVSRPAIKSRIFELKIAKILMQKPAKITNTLYKKNIAPKLCR
jgi:hypothetical protein